MPGLTEFGAALRKIRIDRKLLLKDMADALGYSVPFLSKIECGLEDIPHDMVDKVCDTYKPDLLSRCLLYKKAERAREQYSRWKNVLDTFSVFTKKEPSDPVNEHTSGYASEQKHYQALSEQPIEIMQKLFSAEQLKGFLLGNVIKYSLRCGLKDDPVKEMQKVAQYAAWYVDVAEGRNINPRGDKKCQILR